MDFMTLMDQIHPFSFMGHVSLMTLLEVEIKNYDTALNLRCVLGTNVLWEPHFQSQTWEWPWKWLWPHKRATIKTNVRKYQFIDIFLGAK